MPAAPTKRSIDGEIVWYNTMRTVMKRNYSASDASVTQKRRKCVVAVLGTQTTTMTTADDLCTHVGIAHRPWGANYELTSVQFMIPHEPLVKLISPAGGELIPHLRSRLRTPGAQRHCDFTPGLTAPRQDHCAVSVYFLSGGLCDLVGVSMPEQHRRTMRKFREILKTKQIITCGTTNYSGND
ncbi:hypothetical protein DBV15_01019 [Temnothorax longispinosus]|uniref:Uncharacterized protein n=1 Tax=Temnothorax longispinosus TaxID=300112 RepID=A0A4S2JA87_9HYME|nr:hypothetical protein DBV15_01019 [Temnothorax longispinosus]